MFKKSVNWAEAEYQCSQLNTSLVSIHSIEESDFITSIFNLLTPIPSFFDDVYVRKRENAHFPSKILKILKNPKIPFNLLSVASRRRSTLDPLGRWLLDRRAIQFRS